jgi:hypothetical protein
MQNMIAVARESYRRVAEIRDPEHDRLLCKVYLDSGILEIKSGPNLVYFDLRALLANSKPVILAPAEVLLELERRECGAT